MMNQNARTFKTGILLFGLILTLSLLGPWLCRYKPDQLDPSSKASYQLPSCQHFFGTDKLGRDVFSRVLQGGRISLSIAISVVSLSVLIGVTYGAISGYFGGLLDQILMRLVDILLSFPVIFLALACMALFGQGLVTLIVVLALMSWMDIARLVRGDVQSMKNEPFILKARASGLQKRNIIFHHLIPNAAATITSVAVLRMADVILIESALSFLGLGVQPPMASWGSIIHDGRQTLLSAWWITVFPGSAIVMTTMSLNMIGEGIFKKR